jgi:hypothetical protein
MIVQWLQQHGDPWRLSEDLLLNRSRRAKGQNDDSHQNQDIARLARSAPLSRDATVRHAGPSGDTGEYDAAQVFEIAYQLASMVAKRRDQQG